MKNSGYFILILVFVCFLPSLRAQQVFHLKGQKVQQKEMITPEVPAKTIPQKQQINFSGTLEVAPVHPDFSPLRPENNPQRSVSCSTDDVKYLQSKATDFTGLSINNATSAKAFGQYFDAPGPITLQGFHFYAYVPTPANAPIAVLAEVYLAAPDSLPTGSPLASVMVTISNTDGNALLADLKQTATFNNPVLIQQPYIISISNNAPNGIVAISSDYNNGDGQQEWLSSVLLFNNWLRSYSVNVGGSVFDADFICEPIVNYSVSASFAPSATSGAVALPVIFSNTSSGFFENRMYNTSFTMPWQWQFGDGNNSIEKSPSNTFFSGTYTTELTATLTNWAGGTCSETAMASINVTGPECVSDLIQYSLSKTTSTTGITINPATSATAVAQYFDAPGTLTLYGFNFFAYADESMPIQVEAEVYLVGPDSLPTGLPIASTTVVVANMDGSAPMAELKHTATFASPIMISQPYAVVIRNESIKDLIALFNDYSADDGQQEWLQSILLFNNWIRSYNVNVGGFTFDADLICEPIVTYALSADFTPLALTTSSGQLQIFTNTSSGFFGNRMYNSNLSNAWFWNFDDSNTSMLEDGMNTYTSGGQYNPTLTATLNKWMGGSCQEMVVGAVCVDGALGICELLNAVEGIGCTGSVSASFENNNDAFNLTSYGCYNPAFYHASDANGFTGIQLCGNGEVIAEVTQVTGSGFAGISMRESTAPGAKKLQLMIDGSFLSRRELRQSTGGIAFTHLFQTQGRNWLRITRSGNIFSGYHSSDGVNWDLIISTLIPMSTCIEAGLVTMNGTPTGSLTGTFENVSITGGPAPLTAPGTVDIAAADQTGFSVFPNPASGEVYLGIAPFTGKEVNIRFYNVYGQIILSRQIQEVQVTSERFNINNFHSGAYIIELVSDGQKITRKLVVNQ